MCTEAEKRGTNMAPRAAKRIVGAQGKYTATHSQPTVAELECIHPCHEAQSHLVHHHTPPGLLCPLQNGPQSHEQLIPDFDKDDMARVFRL